MFVFKDPNVWQISGVIDPSSLDTTNKFQTRVGRDLYHAQRVRLSSNLAQYVLAVNVRCREECWDLAFCRKTLFVETNN